MLVMSFLRKLLAALKAFLFGERVETDEEGSFPKIDPEKIKADLRVLENARAHGASGIPDARDTRLTETELQIMGTVGKLRAAKIGRAHV